MKLNIQKIAQLTGHNASIFALTNGKDDQHFLSAGGEGWVAQWDLNDPETGKLIANVDKQIFSVFNLVEKDQILAGNMDGGIHWVDLQNSEETKNIAHHKMGVFGIQQVGNHIFTAGGSGMLTKWSIKERRSLESILLSNKSLRCIDYSPERNELVVGASDHAIYFLNAETLEIKYTIENAHENSVFSVRYHPNKKQLLSGGRDAHLNVWDLETKEKISSQPAHWFTINEIVFSPNGKLFATASRDKTLKIWDAANFKLLKVLETIRDKGHLNSVNALLWSKFENYLLSAGDDRSIIIWKVEEIES